MKLFIDKQLLKFSISYRRCKSVHFSVPYFHCHHFLYQPLKNIWNWKCF